MKYRVKQVVNYLARLREICEWSAWMWFFITGAIGFVGHIVMNDPEVTKQAIGVFMMAAATVTIVTLLDIAIWLLKKASK